MRRGVCPLWRLAWVNPLHGYIMTPETTSSEPLAAARCASCPISYPPEGVKHVRCPSSSSARRWLPLVATVLIILTVASFALSAISLKLYVDLKQEIANIRDVRGPHPDGYHPSVRSERDTEDISDVISDVITADERLDVITADERLDVITADERLDVISDVIKADERLNVISDVISRSHHVTQQRALSRHRRDGSSRDPEEEFRESAGFQEEGVRRLRHKRANKKKKGKQTDGNTQKLTKQINKVKKGLKQLEKKIVEKLDAPRSIPHIHLYADVQVSAQDLQDLTQNENKSVDIYAEGREPIGKYFQQGFVSRNQTYAFWKEESPDITGTFRATNRYVEILKPGVYLIYAQVHFYESDPRLSYRVVATPTADSRSTRNGSPADTREISRCLTGVEPDQSGTRQLHYRSCMTTTTTRLEPGDRLTIEDGQAWRLRHVFTDGVATYWGLIRLCETDQQHLHRVI